MEIPNQDQNSSPMPSALDAGNSGAPPQQVQQPQAAQPQQVQAAPAAQAPVVAPGTPSVTATSPNKHMHGLISRVLGALAGQPPAEYTTDENGKVIAAPSAPESTASKVARITSHALGGLAAGAQVGPRGSAAANIAAGLGAGAQALRGQMSADDEAKKKEAREDFETKQRNTLRQLDIAKANGYNVQLYFENLKKANDLDPVRAENEDIANAFKSVPGHGVRTMSGSAVEAAIQNPNDPTWVHTHLILPAGFAPVLDEDGHPVIGADGKPKSQGQVYVIDATKDGKVPLPGSVVDELNKYKKAGLGGLAHVAGIDGLEPDQELDPHQFVALYKTLLSARVEDAKGWAEAEDGFGGKDGKIPGKINKATGEFRPNPAGAMSDKQIDTKEGAAEKEQQVATGKTTARKNSAEAAKAEQDLNQQNLLNPKSSAGLTGDAYLKTLPQEQSALLTSIAEGRNTKAAIQNRKGELTPLGEALMKAYPDYDVTKAHAYDKVRQDFTSGKTSVSLTAYGTAINHAKALYDNTGPKSYIPGTDEYKRYNQDITYVATEVAKALNPSGVATEGAIKEQEDALRSITNRKAAIENAEHILTGKMAETKQRWANAQVRPSYQPPMPNLSPEAIANADYIRNHGRVPPPPPQTTGHQVGDTIVQNGRTFKVTSVDANGKVTGAQ